MKKVMLTICLVLFAGGCSEPLRKPNIVSSQVFNASYDEVWKATVQTFTELSFQVSIIEKDSGYIGTARHTQDYGQLGSAKLQQVAACPDIFCAIWTHLQLHGSGNVTVQSPNQTKVKIATNIAAYNSNEFGGGGRWYGCYSKGLIEKNYLTTIQGKLKKKKK